MSRSPYKKTDHTILFINPSLSTKSFTRADVLRSYLSLGTLASGVLNKRFLSQLASRLEEETFHAIDLSDLPAFRAEVVQLSRRADRSIQSYLGPIILKCNPSIICVTATSAQLGEAYEAAECAARSAPESLKVIGGAHASVRPCETLTTSKYEVACIGEGTETLAKLALQWTAGGSDGFSAIPGIAYKDHRGEVRRNLARQHNFELDEYPFPSESLHLFLHDIQDTNRNKKDIVYVLAGFGCPFRCSFCAQKAIHRGRIRERSAENLFEEIKALWGKGFRRFALVQETFFVDKTRADRFVDLIECSGLSIEWTAEARADQLDRESLVRYRNAGLRMVQIGLESGDRKLLDHMGKGIRLERVKAVIDCCRDLKINTVLYLLVGLPGQDWQSILRTALFLRENMPYNPATMHCSVAIAIPYPGTELMEKRSVRIVEQVRNGWDWPARNPEVVVGETGEFIGEGPTETDDMTRREIFEAMLYLDDFLHFSLHALYDRSLDDQAKAKARDFAGRMFYMLERRTIRDLIVRAQIDLTPEKRDRAFKEVLRRDDGMEEHFKDVTACGAGHSQVLSEFLTKICFENGYDTMKRPVAVKRIKLMALISKYWEAAEKGFDRISYAQDSEEVGIALNLALDGVELSRAESPGGDYTACLHGFEFEFARDERTLVIRKRADGQT